MDRTGSAVYCLWDDRFFAHEAPPGHPESPQRLQAVRRGLDAAEADGVRLVPLAAEPAADEALLRAHTPAHLAAVAAACREGRALDADTYTSPRSDEIARLAAGSASALGRAVLKAGETDRGFAAIRPPGHHAERERAMGFCLYSNAAVAALDLIATKASRRVAIVDWDVHHGNGTEDVLLERDDVLYVSLHQWPLYPGTGPMDHVGRGRGAGYTVNLPLPPGCGAAEYLYALERVALPILRAFDPDLVVVSAGYDAFRGDPLASMSLPTAAFGAMTRDLLALGKPMAVLLEGGYHPEGLALGVRSTVGALAGLPQALGPESRPAPTPAAVRVIDRCLAVQRAHWPAL